MGTLRGFDDYVNMVLDDVTEYELDGDGTKRKVQLDQVNVLRHGHVTDSKHLLYGVSDAVRPCIPCLHDLLRKSRILGIEIVLNNTQILGRVMRSYLTLLDIWVELRDLIVSAQSSGVDSRAVTFYPKHPRKVVDILCKIALLTCTVP